MMEGKTGANEVTSSKEHSQPNNSTEKLRFSRYCGVSTTGAPGTNDSK
jgi:hypothetical protein